MSAATSSSDRRRASDDILTGAFFGVPPATPLQVQRPQLRAALAQADRVPLVVVSAPAGTGKTATVAEWVREARSDETSWISFEDGDTALWPPLLEALRMQGLAIPASLIETSGAGLGVTRLNTLADMILGGTDRVTVVLDGYELDSLELAGEIDHLLRHSRGRLCLVFIGRVDPILPIYKYRLTGSLLEIRAPELAFSDEETTRLLEAAGVQLDPAAAHRLNDRLSGWIAGLRFAVRALVDNPDSAEHVVSALELTTDINEYLVAEVLSTQDSEVRRLLLDSSVADVFSAELAELLGGATAVRAMRKLVRRQAFVEPVPELPGCYQYYPFFRAFLRAELAYESPERVRTLSITTARWLRGKGQHVRSLAHLAEVGAWVELATQFVEEGLVERLLMEDEGGRLASLVRRLPADVTHPAACVLRAAMALREGGRGHHRCRRELENARGSGGPEELEGVLGLSIATIDALRTCRTAEPGQAAVAAAEADRVLRAELGASLRRLSSGWAALVNFATGVSALRHGRLTYATAELEAALEHHPDCMSATFRADCLGYLALGEALRGDLSRAARHAQESIAVAGRAGLLSPDREPTASTAMAWVGVERCDMKLVRQQAALARSSLLLHANPFCNSLVEAATAAVEHADGHRASALERLQKAAAAARAEDPWIADLLRVDAARLTLSDGRPAGALLILESVHDPDLPEVAVTADAACMELGTFHPAAEGRKTAPSAGMSLDTQVRTLLVEAGQEAIRRSPAQAGPALSRAVRLASTERVRRPFREATPVVRRVVAAHPRLLQDNEWLRAGAPSGSKRHRADTQGALPVVVEPLTAREREVLSHVAELLTNEEIAQKMFVSVNTVRTHLRNILRKLGVNRRNEAVRQARRLGILDT